MGETVIRRLDTLDDMISSLSRRKKKGDATVLQQLKVLREDLLDLLQSNKIEAFAFEKGAELDVAMRRIIKVVETHGSPSKTEKKRPQVEETLRMGFRYVAGKDSSATRIIRKPEVVIGYH